MGSLQRYTQTFNQDPSNRKSDQLPQNDALNALMNELKSSCEAQVERIASIRNFKEWKCVYKCLLFQTKQLILSHPANNNPGHVADVIDKPQEKCRVRFCENKECDEKKDEGTKFLKL